MIFDPQCADNAIYDVTAGGWKTYRELGTDVRLIAEALGVRRKALIFCFCRNDYDALRGYLAGLESGHASALLDDGLQETMRDRLISIYEPDFLIHSRYSPSTFTNGAYELIYSSGPCIWRKVQQDERPIHYDLALLLSTSGSTGTPKFVRLTAANLRSNANSIVRGLNIQGSERAISSLPFYYSYGLSVINTHLLVGASIVLTGESITSRAFWNEINRNHCTSIAGVPYSYQILSRLGLPGDSFPSITTLTQAGGKLQNDLIAQFHSFMERRNGQFFVMYGQTEATARIAILSPGRLPDKLGSAGSVISDGRLRVHRERDSPSGDTTGEVVYSGPNVMLGYATCRADLAKGDELNGILHTGDLGYMDGDGCLFVTGRMNRYAKLSGLRFNLDEVESMLKPFGPSAVVGGDNRLVVFCEGKESASLLQYQREFARQLAIHYRLLEFRGISQLPLKSNGKVDYRVLEEAAKC